MKKKCISTILLARYMEGSASAEEREQVEVHLADCDTCREEFVLASRVMREGFSLVRMDGSPEYFQNIRGKLKGIISGWTEYLRPPIWLAQIRNPEDPCPAVFFETEFNDLKAEFFVQRTGKHEGRVCINIFGESGKTEDIRILVKREGGGTSARVLKQPQVCFDKTLPFGIYHIILRQGKSEIIRSFEMNESGIYER